MSDLDQGERIRYTEGGGEEEEEQNVFLWV